MNEPIKHSVGFWPRIWASPLEGLGFVTILLFLIGTINVFSASFVLGSQLLGDSFYFSRLFKKYYRLSTLHYRKEFRC